jgi:hypothetical protein
MKVDDLDHMASQQGQMLFAHRLHSCGASLPPDKAQNAPQRARVRPSIRVFARLGRYSG